MYKKKLDRWYLEGVDITDIEVEYTLSKETEELYAPDEEGYVWVETSLECYYLLLYNPECNLKCKYPDVQNRIDAYNRSHNLAVFAFPTMREFEESIL